MTASAFDINIITVSGQQLIAAATAANRIVILGVRSKDTAATDADDLASKDISWFDGAIGEILSCSADNGTARILSRFTGSETAGAQTLASVCILAKLANADDSTAVILAASSDTTGRITIPGSSNQFVKVPVNISFSNTSVIQVVSASAAAPSDLLRFVSCHKAGDTESGDDQNIWGEKTFNSGVTFNNYVEAYSGLYVEGEAALADGATIQSLIVSADATVNGTLLSGNIEPILDNEKDLGAASNKWRYFYCKYCIPEYLGITSNRVPNAYITNAYITNLTILGSLTAGTNSNAKNILTGASMADGRLIVNRLDGATANLSVYNATGGTTVSERSVSVPVGSYVRAYIPYDAGSHTVYPGATVQVVASMGCTLALPASSGASDYIDTSLSVPLGYYRYVDGLFLPTSWAGGAVVVLLQRIAESDVT